MTRRRFLSHRFHVYNRDCFKCRVRDAWEAFWWNVGKVWRRISRGRS